MFSKNTSNSRDVAILFGKKFEYKIRQHIRDTDNSRYYSQNQRFTLVNIYGPNNDNPNFFQNIFQYTEEIGNVDFILCGDFNLIIDSEIDCFNYKNINNPKAIKYF